MDWSQLTLGLLSRSDSPGEWHYLPHKLFICSPIFNSIPINVLGIGGQSCNSQAACCDNVSGKCQQCYGAVPWRRLIEQTLPGGLLGVDCDPINLNL